MSSDVPAKNNFSRFYLSQYSPPVPDPGPTACFRACREMARRMGHEFPESTEKRIQLAAAEFEHGEIAPTSAFPYAKEYMTSRLSMGLPVIVGIHYKMG